MADSDGVVEIELLDAKEKSFNASSKREVFSRKLEYMLALIGFTIGLGNVWRFPYLCMRNGGGAFLIPFVICMVTCGLPLYYLELSLAQFAGKSTLVVWEICPLLRGLGFSMCCISFICTWYSGLIMAWTLCYLFYSFYPILPWSTCDNSWNTDKCVTLRTKIETPYNVTSFVNKTPSVDNLSMTASETVTNIGFYPTAANEFWRYQILNASSGLDDLGIPQWHIVLALFLSFTITFLCIVKGVKSVGKVVYVSACLPYLLLTIILIRSLTLEGSVDGILYFIKPNFEKLGQFQVWFEAAVQAFFSLGPAWGGVLTMASFSDFKNKTLHDSLVVLVVDIFTAFFCGFVVFSIVGFLAQEANLTIDEVAESGPGLVFLAYPEALARLPLPQLWSVLFFIMVFNVGLDSEFAMVETITCGLKDMYPKALGKRKYHLLLAAFTVYFITSIILATQAGVYIFQLIDWYASVFCIFFMSFLECVIIGWLYGAERFSRDVEIMTGSPVPVIIRISWCLVTPVIMIILIIIALSKYEEPTYKGYMYPSYTSVLGTFICLAAVIPLPIVTCLDIIRTPGTFTQRIKSLIHPPVSWGPKCVEARQTYKMLKYSKSIWRNMKTNLSGTR
ncbi:sodium- and chloride-dependent glycine transporter 2-like [Ylistrum balloti]|uniref:sodium- and chloride-dependent glycine transporter 2-like n=1 Tax=Ylistrum balloti TaxID=509963 RepID=UPI002905DC4C|nr:sodium- and chloride-dependent glycine transporter 2-like [Ylistrum balloti]